MSRSFHDASTSRSITSTRNSEFTAVHVDIMTLPGHPRWSPIPKIQPVIDALVGQLQQAWKVGEKISIDESMIKCQGRCVTFVQHMPKKPIKHGIKVFALCCADTGHLYSFEIFTGKSDKIDWTTKAIIDRLIRKAGLAGQVGRILFTDNYYTSMDVMKHVHETYGMLFVGTMKLTEKKTRTGADFPFRKLSSGAMKLVQRGWSRVAFQKVQVRGGHFVAQATIWRDKKVVAFLHNHKVQLDSGSSTVERFSPRGKRKKEIKTQPVVPEYQTYYKGVDLRDRDTADWTTSMRSPRFYLRIFFWMLDGVIHSIFCIIKNYVESCGDDNHPWKRYTAAGGFGRCRFQMDLGISSKI